MTVSAEIALGVSLRRLRKAANLTLDDVSRAAGVSAPYLSNVENGNVKPSADWIRNVMTAIGELMISAEGEPLGATA